MTLAEWASLTAITLGVLALIGVVFKLALAEFRTTFMRIEDCTKIQSTCQSKVCSEISELRKEWAEYRKESELKRDLARESAEEKAEKLNETLTEIRIFMARVEPFLPIPQNHNGWEGMNGGTGRGFGGAQRKE